MKKIGLIALIVVLALGVIGVGYALWTQVLTITGTATAGTFNVVFDGSATQPLTTLGGGDAFTVPTGTHTGTITLANIYPGYDTGVMTFDLQNTGSVNASTVIVAGTTTITSGTGTAADLTVTVLPASAQIITPGATDSTHFSVEVVMKSTVTGSQSTVYSIPITVTATQNP
jgi:predicted ribosomally synthesized peptide with SipW-like signal peptide